jgi:hypothetical protein
VIHEETKRGQAEVVGALARQHQRHALGLGHGHDGVLDAGRPLGADEDVGAAVEVRRHVLQQGGQVGLT